MTVKTTSTTWAMYLYGKDAPMSCVVYDYNDEECTTKLCAGEKVLFNLKKVSEKYTPRGLPQQFKFVWKLKNYCSSDERIGHSAAFYRGLSFGVFSPTTGRYGLLGTKVDGTIVDRNNGELSEYMLSFVEDAINNFVYDNEDFEGSELLLRIPSVYKRGSIAVPTKAITKEEIQAKKLENLRKRIIIGSKICDISVDMSSEHL